MRSCCRLNDMTDETSPKEQKARQSRLYTEYYGSAFLLLIALFLLNAFFVIKPIINQVKETNAQTAAELRVTASEQGYLDSLEQSIAAAQTISSPVLQRVSEALPTEANIPALLVQFGSIAFTNGVQIVGISFAENKPASRAVQSAQTSSIVPIDITLAVRVRNYFDLKRFLADVESSLRLLDVMSMSTSGGELGEDIAYTIQLRSYAFSGDAQASDALPVESPTSL
jgi:hypothetical protein